ncbi:ATP-grasp fold amidoligase family protein [Cetobacterium somerae]|uniref:ATP-grasp fold amidoligase family protein n=1 Tax=Cetobacterium somerae TaxID=188913 RepID=UPI0038919FCD
MGEIKKIIKSSNVLYSVAYNCLKIISKIISDEKYIRIKYKFKFGKELDLDNPKTFNEKIQWRILKDRKDIYTQLADKYLVRDYVKEKIGEEYLIKLLGVYERAEDIDYDKLPNKFVLKCNHDSGSVILCEDKLTFDRKEANKKLNFFLKRNFYFQTREWHYRNIKPLIICEEFLEETGKVVDDYKVYIFNKKNQKSLSFIQIEEDRFENHRRGIYTENWELLPVKRILEHLKKGVKPKNWN